ncbi:MAG: UvrD-helicase domain-containing protein [Rhodocyclaceae bacterium]|nr:UvrD-helicase domain-containing protein [Rhodocyclaceae bacterium]MDZ4216616.1 UvrD-helicase domain-containing protein [Rhodocyclaceae bacterium]
MTEMERLDSAARARALTLDQSFIVQAPAGAGKTELLTQRYLGLLACVEAPEQIVAITFTRKAAAEMRNRILLRLAKAADPEPTTLHEQTSWRLARAAVARDRELGWGLGEQPERLRITTIDALCASLVRQMPYLSRFGGMPRIADKPFLHYEEAAHRTVAAVESYPAVAQALACLDNDGAQLRRLLVGMLAFREQWWPHVHGLRAGDDADREQLGEALTENLQRLVARDLSAAAEALHACQTEELFAAGRHVALAVGDEKPAFAALADWSAPLTADVTDLPCWQALAALLLNNDGDPRKAFDARMGLPAKEPAVQEHRATLKQAAEWLAEQPVALDALRSAAGCPLPHYAAGDLAAIETFAEVLVLAVAQLWTVFQEAGETDFSAIAERALEALGDADAPSDLALRLDYGIRHLLVDEFQDTNPQQIALLEKLTAGWQQGDGRTLFVVGDPMQSIYRFRKADVGLFLRAWQRGIGSITLEPLTLYRNNRSVPAIVDWVNASFPTIFPAQADAERGRVSYAPSIATRDARPGGGVFVHPVLVPKDVVAGDEAGDAQEAAAMLQIIADTWRAQPQATIAVLVRARDHLRPLIDALRRDAPTLRYEAVEIESLGARQPIQDLLSLTHALCHRADRVHWLAILRAPWCGLTLADLHALAGNVGADRTAWSLMHDQERIAALSDDGRQRLAHAVAALAPVIEAPGRLPLRRQVETAWRRLGGRRCLSSATDHDDVAAYFRLLDELEARGRFERDRLDAEVMSLFAAASSDPLAAQLKFMTVHKAKGLEFDSVILPGLHRQTGRNERRLLTWDSTQDEQGRPHLVVAPIRTIDSEADEFAEADESEEDSIRRYIATLEAERADQETRRLLYVAATRSVRCLHLLAVARPKREAKTGLYKIDPPRKQAGKPFNILWPILAEAFDAATTRLETPAVETVDSLPRYADFVPQLQRLPLAALAISAHGEADEAPPALETPLYLAASSLAPDVGTLVHRYLELIATEGLDHWSPDRVQACQPTCEKWLRQQGHDVTTSQQGAARVRRALTHALTSERGRWILQARADDACELALTQQADGALRNHIIDRSFVEAGVRWIIDYKTSVHEGGDIDAFIAAKRAEYAPQLARYAALFPGESVRQALYFVDIDRFEVLAD